MAFELKPLTFPKESLGPTMSASTLEHHHDKHHAGYVKKLNELIAGTKFAGSDLESIVRATARGRGARRRRSSTMRRRSGTTTSSGSRSRRTAAARRPTRC